MSYAERCGLASSYCAICGHRCHLGRICIHCKRRYGLDLHSTKHWPAWARWLDNYHERQRYYERLRLPYYSPYLFTDCTRRYGTWSVEDVMFRRMERAGQERENEARCAALLAPIPARERAAVMMRYYHEMTYDEIGAALGYTRVWARKLVERGVEMARRAA
jgi:RNA polymerase sigma factor (sigma-70 family)